MFKAGNAGYNKMWMAPINLTASCFADAMIYLPSLSSREKPGVAGTSKERS